jgi:hypothetical protein
MRVESWRFRAKLTHRLLPLWVLTMVVQPIILWTWGQAALQRGLPPREPTVYVAITSKSDPGHAPAGKENWFVLVNVPATNPNWDWHSRAESYRELVLDKLAGYGYDLHPRLAYSRVLTPLDIASRTGAQRGALYGTSSKPAPGCLFTAAQPRPGAAQPVFRRRHNPPRRRRPNGDAFWKGRGADGAGRSRGCWIKHSSLGKDSTDGTEFFRNITEKTCGTRCIHSSVRPTSVS